MPIVQKSNHLYWYPKPSRSPVEQHVPMLNSIHKQRAKPQRAIADTLEQTHVTMCSAGHAYLTIHIDALMFPLRKWKKIVFVNSSFAKRLHVGKCLPCTHREHARRVTLVVSFLSLAPNLSSAWRVPQLDRKASLQSTLHMKYKITLHAKYENSTTQNVTPTTSKLYPCQHHKLGAKDGQIS